MALVLNGKIVQEKIALELKEKINSLDPKPKLAIVQIGNVEESNLYIEKKIQFGRNVGAIVEHIKLPENAAQNEVLQKIEDLNHDDFINGIIVQLPIPKNLLKNEIIESINPLKDVDGLTSTNIKMLWEGETLGHIPATTKGIITLLKYYNHNLEGKNIVIIGRSSLVGKPTAIALLNENATVTICHSKTKDLEKITKNAQIIISAVGKPNLITNSHVTNNQTIIDVGTTIVDGKLIGDVDFINIEKIVKEISPVPGGIGPLTVASLFENLFSAYISQK